MNPVDLLDRIDDLTAPTGHCRVCDVELDGGAPSDDFCGELHQQLWTQRRARRDGSALTEAEVAEILRRHGEQLAAVAAAMRPALEQLVRGFHAAARALSERMRDAGLVPDVSPDESTTDDPKARALAARRNRNTGPVVHADPRRNRRPG